MHFKHAVLALLCVAEQAHIVSAKSVYDSLLEASVKRSDISINHERIHRRLALPEAIPQAPATASSSSSAAAPSATASKNATDAACVARLAALNGLANSPTGMSMCYDINSLDMATGKYESQIYLYQVSAATGNWTTIDSTSLNVDISYAGANLTQAALARRFSEAIKREATDHHLVKRVTHPVLIISEVYGGQVVSGWDSQNQTQMMMELTPSVMVTAKTPTGQPLSSTLSKTEAAFIMGTFSDKAAAQFSAAAAAATNTPFVLPGVTIAFFPIGLITTGLWMVLFVSVVGLGTLGRLQFRQSYRRRAVSNSYPAGGQKSGVAAYDRR